MLSLSQFLCISWFFIFYTVSNYVFHDLQLTSQIITFEHEGNWSKALEYYDLQVRSEASIEMGNNSSRDQSLSSSSSKPEDEMKQRKPHKGLIKSLQQIGCTHMLDMYCQGLMYKKGRFQDDLEFNELQVCPTLYNMWSSLCIFSSYFHLFFFFCSDAWFSLFCSLKLLGVQEIGISLYCPWTLILLSQVNGSDIAISTKGYTGNSIWFFLLLKLVPLYFNTKSNHYYVAIAVWGLSTREMWANLTWTSKNLSRYRWISVIVGRSKAFWKFNLQVDYINIRSFCSLSIMQVRRAQNIFIPLLWSSRCAIHNA